MEEALNRDTASYLTVIEKDNIKDYQLIKEFLQECPIRMIYLTTKKEDERYIPRGISCSICNEKFYYPYSIIYHCCDCDGGNYDTCQDCFPTQLANHIGHNVDISYMLIILIKYYGCKV